MPVCRALRLERALLRVNALQGWPASAPLSVTVTGVTGWVPVRGGSAQTSDNSFTGDTWQVWKSGLEGRALQEQGSQGGSEGRGAETGGDRTGLILLGGRSQV